MYQAPCCFATIRSGGGLVGESLPQLLHNPCAGGMPRDIEMQHASAIMTYNEEAIEHAESQRRNSEEIHRDDGLPMIAQEARPSSGSARVSGRSAHPTGDSPLGNIETQHEKFTVNTRCPPGRVLGHHSKYEIADFLRNPSSAAYPGSPGDETPIECESRSVRTHDRLWIHDNESLFPSRPEPSSQNPQELIECRQPWPGMFSFQCRELLAKGQVFKEQSLTSLEEARDCAYK